MEGDHIKGSPFPVTVMLPVQELGNPVETIIGLNKPWGVAINDQGNILVIESAENRVSIIDATGRKIHSFGSKGSVEGQFSGPFGLAIDDNQDILVVNRDNHRIQKFSSDGTFLEAVGTHGSGQLPLLQSTSALLPKGYNMWQTLATIEYKSFNRI